MKINKVVQSLAKNFCSDWNIRPTLAWVYFTKNKAVATNSFKLCEIEFLEKEISKEDLNLKDFAYKKYDESIMIHKDDFLKLPIPKIKEHPVLENIYIWNIKVGNQNQAELRSFDWENTTNISIIEMNWKFPDYEIFFQNDGTLKIWIWVNELIELLQVYKKSWVDWVNITLWQPLQPIIIESRDSSEFEMSKNWIKQIKSILMPLKI